MAARADAVDRDARRAVRRARRTSCAAVGEHPRRAAGQPGRPAGLRQRLPRAAAGHRPVTDRARSSALKDGAERRSRSERVRRQQGDRRGAVGEPRHRGHQVRRLPADRLVLDARRVDPLGGRLRQPGAAAASAAGGPGARRRPSTRSATAASATSTRSSSSIVLFSVGGLFALYEGYHKLQHPEPIDAWQWVPVAGARSSPSALESFSFRTAIVESNHVRGDLSWVQFIRRAKAPELPVVLLEDLAALIGLVLALVRGRPDADHRRRHLGRPRAPSASACCSSWSPSCSRSRPRACCSARAPRPDAVAPDRGGAAGRRRGRGASST